MAGKISLPIYEEELQRDLQARLSKIEGQVRGVARMLEGQRLCIDVLQQLASIQAALRGVTKTVLRNYLERCLVFEEPMPLGEDHGGGPAVVVPPTLAAGAAGAAGAVDPDTAYAEARRQALEAFERAYVRELLNAHGGRVSAAARAAGIGRVYLYRLMRRHGMQSPPDDGAE